MPNQITHPCLAAGWLVVCLCCVAGCATPPHTDESLSATVEAPEPKDDKPPENPVEEPSPVAEPLSPATEDRLVHIDLTDSSTDATAKPAEPRPQEPTAKAPPSPTVAPDASTEPATAEPPPASPPPASPAPASPAPAAPAAAKQASDTQTDTPSAKPDVAETQRARRYAEVLARRLSANPDQPLVAARLARLWLEANEPTRARDLLLKGPPPGASPEALAIWASAQISAGEMDAARHTLERALSKTRSGGGLVLRDLSLCQRVLSYANYEPLDSHILWPGSTVRIYAEIVNANAQLQTKLYHLRLRWSLRVLDDEGQAVWTREPQDLVLVSRRPTQDNFITIPFSTPRSLGRGGYSLELTVIDRSNSEDRSTTASIGFELR